MKSARVDVPETHLSSCKMELHGTKDAVGLLVLVHSALDL